MSPCIFCGAEHEHILGLGLGLGMGIYRCSKIPPETVYIDTAFDSGPRGALYRIDELERREG